MTDSRATIRGGEIPARLVLFGFQPTAGTAHVLYRTRSWRATRALLAAGLALGLAPLFFLIPPHVPWVLAALGTGGYLARKYWTEHYTLRSFRGACPKCRAEQVVDGPVKLRMPHVLSCMGCQHELWLEPELELLDRGE